MVISHRYKCGAPQLHLRYPDETMSVSIEAQVEFKLVACLSVDKLKRRACLNEGRS